jgi:formylglycine-generating enzyme required for sulfatase activity/tetratricopeptide (TPR) repeat protein
MRKTVIMAAAVAAACLAGCGGKGTRGKAASEAADRYNIEMVFVEGGTFTIGCTEEQGEDCHPDTKPAHTVTVSSFYIGKYEVTQAQWKAVMGSAHNVENEGDDLPVDNVSWNDAQVFIRKLNAKTGKVFRLPTEAEWEYAARGGKGGKGYKYAGSNNIDEVGWYKGNSGGETHPVGQKAPNELGLYDMTGNVWENMCNWHEYYNDSAKTNPVGPISGKYRVSRSGSWREETLDNRISVRFVDTPGNRDDNCGFRLVLSPATEADTGGIWTLFYDDETQLAGYMDKYSRVRIEPKFSRYSPCEEFDNIIGVMARAGEEWEGYYLTKAGKIIGRDSLYVSHSGNADCETEGFIRFSDNKTKKTGLFDRNGKTVIPAEYDELGNVINGVIIALRDAEEECEEDGEHSGCYKTGGSNMLIDTSNNVLIEEFPDSYRLYLDFFSMEKSKAPHPDTAVRESFPAKGGGYYSFIDIMKEFKRWIANDMEAALKADILNPALKADKNNPDPKKLIDWHITDYWDHAIIDNNGKVGKQKFIVRNFDNLIREARNPDMIHIDETDIYEGYIGNSKKMVFPDIDVIGSDGGIHSHYKYSRTGGGGYTLSGVTVRTDELILDTEVYSALGKAYFEGEYYKEAIVYFEKAIESDPDCAAEYYKMEESGKEKGEKPKWEKASGEAAKYFRDIIKPEPAKCAASFYGMGEAYIEDGDESKGQAFKKKAEQLGYTP